MTPTRLRVALGKSSVSSPMDLWLNSDDVSEDVLLGASVVKVPYPVEDAAASEGMSVDSDVAAACSGDMGSGLCRPGRSVRC